MKKTKHLIVRITETQLKQLADAIMTEQKNKSTIVREALDKYMDEYMSGKQNQMNNEFKRILK